MVACSNGETKQRIVSEGIVCSNPAASHNGADNQLSVHMQLGVPPIKKIRTVNCQFANRADSSIHSRGDKLLGEILPYEILSGGQKRI